MVICGRNNSIDRLKKVNDPVFQDEPGQAERIRDIIGGKACTGALIGDARSLSRY